MANYEQLFLLEVLVDKVRLLTQALAAFAPEVEDEPDTPIRVRVKFSDFPCFEITQDLAPPDPNTKDSEVLITAIEFSSGKSCMFPMDPEQLMTDLVKYPMAVTVFKKNTGVPMPDIIGQTKVPLGDYMTNIIKKALEWTLEEPTSEYIQDTFPLRNAQDQDVGTINMLIRLTCFGKTIITKFQIADNKKSFLFRNAHTKDYEFQCKKCKPGQPIMRPLAPCPAEEYGEYEDEPPTPYYQEKAAMTEDPFEPAKCDKHTQGPGFQKHEIQGDGFTASMEVHYPKEDQEWPEPCDGASHMDVQRKKKRRRRKKKKAKGMENDVPKANIQCPVELDKQKKKKKTKFHVEPNLLYPGVILGHKYCIQRGPPIPPENGWAWKHTVPAGMKYEDFDGWVPGAFLKSSWLAIKQEKKERALRGVKKRKVRPVPPDLRKTTIHLHRQKGVYHVTMHPVTAPGEPEKEPLVYTLERPEDDSDLSEIELDVIVPDAPFKQRPRVKHQEQQFREEDLPLPVIKPYKVRTKKVEKKREVVIPPFVPMKKKPGTAGTKDTKGKYSKDKKKDGKGGKTAKGKGKGPVTPRKRYLGDDVYPWDNWIMNLKCKYESTPVNP